MKVKSLRGARISSLRTNACSCNREQHFSYCFICVVGDQSTLESTISFAKLWKGMLFSVEQAFVWRDEIRALLKTPKWEATCSLPAAIFAALVSR